MVVYDIHKKLNTDEDAFRATESLKLRFKSYPAGVDFCHLITFTNSLYPDQAQQNV